MGGATTIRVPASGGVTKSPTLVPHSARAGPPTDRPAGAISAPNERATDRPQPAHARREIRPPSRINGQIWSIVGGARERWGAASRCGGSALTLARKLRSPQRCPICLRWIVIVIKRLLNQCSHSDLCADRVSDRPTASTACARHLEATDRPAAGCARLGSATW